tara:strand:- start:28 stop:357 length:330 start_codon:yes stop_codon:yes gene_type:complete
LTPATAAVLDKAVRAYQLAKRKARLQKSVSGREAARSLAKEFPEFFSLNGIKGRHLTYTGVTADSIIERHLNDLGEKRGSKSWQRLAAIVIARGELGCNIPPIGPDLVI